VPALNLPRAEPSGRLRQLWTTTLVPAYALPENSERSIETIPPETTLQVILIGRGDWYQVAWMDGDGTNHVKWINAATPGVTTIPPEKQRGLTSPVPTPSQGTLPRPSNPSLPSGEEIPLIKVGGVYALPVEINGVLTLQFILDSGAAEVNIPADVVFTLVRTGTIKDTDFLPGKTYVLADGSTLRSPRFTIRTLKIGSRHIQDVPASVGNLTSGLLLGQSFLERLGTWGIDNQKNVLVIPSGAGISQAFTAIEGKLIGSWKGSWFRNGIHTNLVYTFNSDGSFSEMDFDLSGRQIHSGVGQYSYANGQIAIRWFGSGAQERALLVWTDGNTFRYHIINHSDTTQVGREITFRKLF